MGRKGFALDAAGCARLGLTFHRLSRENHLSHHSIDAAIYVANRIADGVRDFDFVGAFL